MTTTRILLLATVMLASSSIALGDQKATRDAPNVIYIFPDQYRLYSLGFWSQSDNAKYLQGEPDPVATPALDRLANEGVVFSRAVSNYPLCSPYRGMLLSGMYPDKSGLTTNCRSDRTIQLRTDAVCITDVFSGAGYDVAYFGKCHWHRTEPLFDSQGNYVGTTEAPGGHYMNAVSGSTCLIYRRRISSVRRAHRRLRSRSDLVFGFQRVEAQLPLK